MEVCKDIAISVSVPVNLDESSKSLYDTKCPFIIILKLKNLFYYH